VRPSATTTPVQRAPPLTVVDFTWRGPTSSGYNTTWESASSSNSPSASLRGSPRSVPSPLHSSARVDEQTEPDAEGEDDPAWNLSTGCTSTTNGASWTYGASNNPSTSFNGYMQPQTELWNTPGLGFTPLSGHHAGIALSPVSNIPSWDNSNWANPDPQLQPQDPTLTHLSFAPDWNAPGPRSSGDRYFALLSFESFY
jgi:hypothetical protein